MGCTYWQVYTIIYHLDIGQKSLPLSLPPSLSPPLPPSIPPSSSAIHTLVGHRGEISNVAFDYVGNQLATVSMDRTCKIWDIRSGKLTTTLRYILSFNTP